MDEGEEEKSTATDFDFTKPEPPSVSDCCNSGCSPCVFDLYDIRLAEWLKRDKFNKNKTKVRYDLLSETKFKPFILLEKRIINRSVYFLKFQPYLLKVDSENDEILEQSISGILDYRPGQHLVIKNCENNLHEFLVENNLVLNSENEAQGSLQDSSVASSTRIGNNLKSLKTSGEQLFITRAYTPVSLSSERVNCTFNIVVKLYKNGVMSKYFSELNVGGVSYFRGPYGNFQYVPNSYRSILMICIGTGIAPMYSIAKHILNNEADETIIKVLYGSRHVDDIILRQELTGMTSYWNFSLTYFLTNGELNFTKKFGEHFVLKRICESEIINNFSHKKDQLYLICGSEQFNADILSVVLKNGADMKHIHVF